ncbi:MAG: hypothetical protein EPO31_06890 [Gammaproteobacteria bacterium]|nr:MAG: hypothetical protein EPO31_06890 [Gammaproteobacteria bacterium]
MDLPTLTLLDADGTLLFSTNRRGFKLEVGALKQTATSLQIEDITRATLPRDFQRGNKWGQMKLFHVCSY